ncbi:DUF4760 domain-containing protein [Streptomyces sp. NPDC008092]|uniref:DUF4760 domain-containing protein n=1 Tax=Streptomyces sp. NPDC008092 TaxID=3364808 RepID=UPI0036EF1AFE
MTVFERWSLVAAFGSLGVGVVGFVGLAWQLLMLARSTERDHERRRKQATMEFLADNMNQRKSLFDEGIPQERDQAAIAALISRSLSGDEQATKLVTSYLTTFNLLGAGTRLDAFDRQLIDEAWGGLIISVWDNYRPWAEAQRHEHSEPRLWRNLEWLAAHMTPRRLLPPVGGSGGLPPAGTPAG